MALLEEMPHKEYFFKNSIELRVSPTHRYGVFAIRDIAPKEIIEECPVIIFRGLKIEYREEISSREFFWDDLNSAIALGYGSMYNHADDSNATYAIDHDDQILRFITTKHIAADTEILVHYGNGWFASRKETPESLDPEQKRNNIGVFKVAILLLTLFVLSQVFPIHSESLEQFTQNLFKFWGS